MDSDEPVHSFKVDFYCKCLGWRPNGKTEDFHGEIDAARKSKKNFTIAWQVTFFFLEFRNCFVLKRNTLSVALEFRGDGWMRCVIQKKKIGRAELGSDAMAFHLLVFIFIFIY